MKKSKFSLTRYKDERIVELVKKTDPKTLAVWAIDCAERVLPYFKEKYPEDHRPRNAIETHQIRLLKKSFFSNNRLSWYRFPFKTTQYSVGIAFFRS